MSETRNNRRQLTGVVTSTKGAKTITVEVVRTYKHPKYGKFVKRSAKHMAHDETEVAKDGDTVVISSTRPMSKLKRWRLVEVLGSSLLAATDVEAAAELASAMGSEEGAGEAGGDA